MILDYKNSNVHYTIDGAGATLVLLHGFLENVTMWDLFIPKLSKTHQVICVDLLGHGATDCIGYVHTMEDMAEAVAAVLEHHSIIKAKVVGHSMGGYVALALAKKQPELFEGLCLVNSTFEADDAERKLLRMRANKMAQNNFENLVRLSFVNLFAPESKKRHKNDLDKALEIALLTPLQGYIAAQKGMTLRPDRFQVLKKLSCKKFIVIGKKDTVMDGKRIINTIRDTNIEYEEFSEGHMSHIENSNELTYLLSRFVEKLD